MRGMVNFPRLRRVRVAKYELYPGTPPGTGLDWRFSDGLSIAIGINGLGKTTFVNMLLWGLLGGKRLPKADQFGIGAGRFTLSRAKGISLFAERVTDRAADATIELWFDLGATPVYLERRLSNLALQKLKIGGVTVKAPEEDDYLARIAEHAGLRDDYQFHVIVRALLFFLEERVTLLWDRAAQFEILRILLLDEELAEKLQKLGAEILKEDSDLRNLRYVLNKLQDQYGISEDADDPGTDGVAKLEAQLALLNSQKQALADRLEDLTQERSQSFEDLQQLIEKKFRVDISIGEDEARVHELQHAWLQGLTPTTEDTTRLLLADLLSGNGCGACGSRDPGIRYRVENDFAQRRCPICHSGAIEQENPGPKQAAPDVSSNLTKVLARLDAQRLQSRALEDEIRIRTAEYDDSKSQLLKVTTEHTALERSLEETRNKLPREDEDRDNARRQILENRMYIDRLRRGLIEKRKRYVALLEKADEDLSSATKRVQKKFSGYAQQFLREKVDLEYKPVLTALGQELARVPIPSFSVRMTSSIEPETPSIRATEETVSESQKEYLELAFRMAVMDAAGNARHKGLLVMETPEASLDAVFSDRAGLMLREFAGMAAGPRTPRAQVIVTCNLNGAPLIGALLGKKRPSKRELSERTTRVLNFLKIAAPNAAYRDYHDIYDKAFREATGL
jgi:hypothetical protein